jgi:3-dehydroquinate synthase
MHQVPAGEGSKTLARAAEQYAALARLPADRGTLVVAVGGGVVGDLAGFVAATYARGLPWLVVPTSLLAMVDSAIGGKVGVNLPEGKNLVGAFHQPLAVWSCLDFLATLPEREFRSGLAEVVKYGVIADADFFHWLQEHTAAVLARDRAALVEVVKRSAQIKAAFVAADEREETGLRAQLNYGHTFGHAFEVLGGYQTWLHGEAVAAGMMCAARLAVRLGLCSAELPEKQARLLTAFGLPTAAPTQWRTEQVLAAMAADKKRHAGRRRFILPRRLGQVELVEVTNEAAIAAALASA